MRGTVVALNHGMPGGIYASLSGAAANLRGLEVVANNIANVDTAGFRRDGARFDAVLGTAIAFADAETSRIDLSPGATRSSSSQLHGAIDGDGFFVIATPDGERYTRRGDFVTSPAGILTLPSGEPVLGTGGPIEIPPGVSAVLSPNGAVLGPDGVLAQLRVVRFAGPDEVVKVGESTLAARDGVVPQPVEQPNIATGAVEVSNVNLSGELVALILAQRSVEASMNALRINDEMTQSLIQVQR